MHKPSTHRCRTCGIPLPEGVNSPFSPFCSKRCRMVDLGRWFSGDYAISEEIPSDVEEDDPFSEADPRPE
ncbi:MAG: DNA gyrase inhibitor YacG [Candidatus Omnitrophica bacterium]|nr:DNA gyrase inhibitor YacG [Candidatus Omnitrophota bacterium]